MMETISLKQTTSTFTSAVDKYTPTHSMFSVIVHITYIKCFLQKYYDYDLLQLIFLFLITCIQSVWVFFIFLSANHTDYHV